VVARGLRVVRVRVEEHVARPERGERRKVRPDLIESALARDARIVRELRVGDAQPDPRALQDGLRAALDLE